MVEEDCRQPAMLKEEVRRRGVYHAPSRAARVKQGKITVPALVANALDFQPPDLVATVNDSLCSSSGGRCHPTRP